MGLTAIPEVAKYGLWLLLLIAGAWFIWRVVRFFQKSGENKIIMKDQENVIDSAEKRITVEQETKHRDPEDIARDIGATGGGRLRREV